MRGPAQEGDGKAGAPDPNAGPHLSAGKNSPGVTVETPLVDGVVPVAVVNGVVARQASAVVGCYEPERARHPSLAGKVVLRLMIGSSGDVVAAALEESSLKNAHVEGCLVNIASTWAFPDPGGGTTFVLLPLVFAAGSRTGR